MAQRCAGKTRKRRIFTQKKIDYHLAYIDNKVEGYIGALADADGEKREELEKKIEQKAAQKKKYELLNQQLNESGDSQISISDPDTRLLVKGNKSIVGYNVQSVVDAKNNIPIDYEVTNKTDSGAMAGMLEQTIEVLNLEKDEYNRLTKELEALFDTGYHNGEQIQKTEQLGVTTYVCEPKPAKRAGRSPAYDLSEFEYRAREDIYICPQNQTLKTTGVWSKTGSGHLAKTYRTKACNNCPFRDKCTKAKAGRIIRRSEYAKSYERNKI